MVLTSVLQEPDFEGDRIVVRGEDDEKKRSWFFGRTKKAGKVDGGYVSRPPSAVSFPRRASVAKEGKTSLEANADDELPPRVDPTSAAVLGGEVNAAATAEAEPKERESIDARLPARAGFDFAAIKHVIGSSEKGGDDKTAAKNGIAIAAPTEDSSKLKLGDRLTSLFHRSSSSSSLTAAVEEEKQEDNDPRSRNYHREEEEFGGFETASPMPNLTFADYTGSAWGGDRPPPFSVSLPLASASTSHLASGKIPSPSSRPDILDRASSSPRISYGIPTSPITPSASTPGSHFTASSLSFGGADGSISVSPSSGLARGDPWSAPLTLDHALDGRKRTANTGFDPNPWS